MPNSTVIAVGRQFGSGGRKIAKLMAERLGLPYYDRELLRETASRMGFSPEVFAANDEKRPSLFRSLASHLYGVADNYGSTPMSRDEIYRQQGEVIRDIASRGGCVIVGRSADYLLRDHPGLISIFLHAPLSWRIKRIIERGEAKTEHEAEVLAHKIDSQRESFYNYFTPGMWGYAPTYHLSIDASKLDPEQIVDLIENFAKHKSANKD
ncbi:MAG: cytidylate kinase-like family protein [Bacteroides sp.]|nr:cytidylate kinase-like family protein [Bacteroides sp.]